MRYLGRRLRVVLAVSLLALLASLLVACTGPMSPRDDAVRSYDLDVPSEPAVTPSTPSETYSTTLSWSWTPSGGGDAVYRYRLNGGAWTVVSGTTTYDPGGLYPGTYIFEVEERDGAGNWSSHLSSETTIKAQEPAAVTIYNDGATQGVVGGTTTPGVSYQHVMVETTPSFSWDPPVAQLGQPLPQEYAYCWERLDGENYTILDMESRTNAIVYIPPVAPRGTYRFRAATVTLTGIRSAWVDIDVLTERESYPITYDPNGAVSGTVPANQVKIEGITLTLASNSGSLAATNPLLFTGWNTATDGSGVHFNVGSSYTTDAPLTLYAEWTPGVTVTYDANDPSVTGTVAPQFALPGTDIVVPDGTGYVTDPWLLFDSWNTDAGGGGTPYFAGMNMPVFTDVTLYAQWAMAPGYYSVSYYANGGTGTPPDDPNYYQDGENFTVLGTAGLTPPVGQSFIGWDTDPAGSGTISPGISVMMPMFGMDLYAIWG